MSIKQDGSIPSVFPVQRGLRFKPQFRRVLIATFVPVLAVLLSSCERARDRSQSASVRMVFNRQPITYLPAYMADALGYYKQEGVTVKVEEVAGGSKAMQALLGGSADVAVGAYEQTIQIAAEGRRVQSFVEGVKHFV